MNIYCIYTDVLICSYTYICIYITCTFYIDVTTDIKYTRNNAHILL